MKMRSARWYHSLASLLCLAVVPAHALSDVSKRDLDATGGEIQAAPADPAIEKALTRVSPEQIQRTIEKLVSFHNRSTLSSMEKDLPPGPGRERRRGLDRAGVQEDIRPPAAAAWR